MQKFRLADIAAQTGVTVPTVSKVLNGRADVAPATRARILEILEESGYQRKGRQGLSPNQPAVTGFIDLVINPVGKSWAIEVIGGVQPVASAAGYDIAVTIASYGSDWLGRIIRRGSRGLVAERWFLSDDERNRLTEARIPFVVIDPGAEPPPGVLSVGATNWNGGYSAADHLVSLGHERIAVIGGSVETLASQARIDGFKSSLASKGITLDPALLRHADWSRAGAEAIAAELLTMPNRPTAIFACSDRMASGVYNAANELGLSIPGDLSVVGFDDLPEVGWLKPSLTTVRQPVEEMGRTALQLILARDRGRRIDSERIELSTTLVVRDSTAPPAA